MLLKDAQVAIKVIVVKQKKTFIPENVEMKMVLKWLEIDAQHKWKELCNKQFISLVLLPTVVLYSLHCRYFPSQGFREAYSLPSREK